MYGHAANLFPPCHHKDCKCPGTIKLDDGAYSCAAHAMETPEKL